MSLEVTDQNFEAEIKSHKGVSLVDFWAPWCGPCQMMGPVIEELADEMKDDVKIKKLNVDENPATAQSFNVMSIPTMIVYKDGEEVERIVGVQNKDSLKEKLSTHK